MSVVVAVYKDNKIVMASDTIANFGDLHVPVSNYRSIKVKKVGNSYIGTTGWAIYENVFDDLLKNKQMPNLMDEGAIYTFFLKLWKQLHEKYAFVNDQCNDTESPFGDLDSSFLIANKNGIFHVASDMCISKFTQYFAIGAGCEIALGALFSLYEENYGPEEIARKAVEAAIAFKAYCGGNIDIVML